MTPPKPKAKKQVKPSPKAQEPSVEYQELIARDVAARAKSAIGTLLHLPCGYDEKYAKAVARSMTIALLDDVAAMLGEDALEDGLAFDELSQYEEQCLDSLLDQVSSHEAPRPSPPPALFLQRPGSA